jgi:hypothetical protein
LTENLAQDSVADASAREAGMTSAVVLPVLKSARMTAAVAWYL